MRDQGPVFGAETVEPTRPLSVHPSTHALRYGSACFDGGGAVRAERRMWTLIEPINAVVYFAPEHRRAQDETGLKGGWMAYFASRSAPLGPVPAEVVTALFYNFAPAMVARAIPDAWRFASPDRVLQARYTAVGQALSRLVGAEHHHALAQATDLLAEAASGCDVAGRPMYAANAALDWPEEPFQRLWHATTLLREHRGDGHVTALLAHEVDGCEAHVLAAARGVTTAEQVRPSRGWADEEWVGASKRLRGRRLLTSEGELTSEGRALHDDIERLTDRLAEEPWARLSHRQQQDLAALLTPALEGVHEAGAIPYPNPMGLPPPEGLG